MSIVQHLKRLPWQSLGRRYYAVKFKEELLLPESERVHRDEMWQIIGNLHPERDSGFRIELEVHHGQKKIDVFTESMSNYEKHVIYARHRNRLRNAFPDYVFIERHV
jgi:hypothetical protein